MIFSRNDEVVSRPEGDKAIVLDQKTGRVYILNSTSAFLFEHCTGEVTPEQMANALTDRFEIPESYAEPSRLLNLVTRHLDLLSKARLLKTVAA